MAKCPNCDGDLLRTDAFCGTCGEPIPGAKAVVPISRGTIPAGSQQTSHTTTDSGIAAGQLGRVAAAVVAISDPSPRDQETRVTQTAIREREQPSEPASVLPLHRKKVEAVDLAEPEPEAPEIGDKAEPAGVENPAPAAPPILASHLLRDRMQPPSPGARTIRGVSGALCAAGIAGVLALGGVEPMTFVCLALLIGIGTLALTPMSYAARAGALFILGAISAGVGLWQQSLEGIAPDSIILATSVILLGGSLLFRAYYRGARLARLAVSVGILTLGAWFFLSGGHHSLVSIEGNWESWAPATVHLAFGFVGLLSFTAFMDSSTRAGTHLWSVSLLALYAIHVGLLIVSHGGVNGGATPTAMIVGAVGAIVASLALAQVFVVLFVAAKRRNRQRAR